MSEKRKDNYKSLIDVVDVQEDNIEKVVRYTLCDHISELGLTYDVPIQALEEEKQTIYAEQVERLEGHLQKTNPKTREVTLKNGITMHIIDD